MSTQPQPSTPLDFKVEKHDRVMWIMWTNGAGRPATECEVALWTQLEAERKTVADVMELLHKQFQPLATAYFARTGKSLHAPVVPPALPPPPATTVAVMPSATPAATPPAPTPLSNVTALPLAKPAHTEPDKPATPIIGMSEARKAELRKRFMAQKEKNNAEKPKLP